MRLIFIALSILFSSSAFSNICSRVAGCGSCVSTKSSQLTVTRDSSCFASLSSRNGANQSYRPSSSINHFSFLYTFQDSSTGISFSTIAASVDRAYQDHQMRQNLGTFYSKLPEMLDNHHNQLILSIKTVQDERQESFPERLHAFKNEIHAVKNTLSEFKIPRLNTSPNVEYDNDIDFEYRNQYQNLLEDIDQDDFLKSFPNFTGRHEENLLARETRRNSYIKDPELKLFHQKILAGAEKFKNTGSEEHYQELIDEAKKIRRGEKLEEKSLTSRFESFELNQSLIADKKDLLGRKIYESQEEGWAKDRLSVAQEMSSFLQNTSSETFFSGNLEAGEKWGETALGVLDLALGFVPGISVGKDFLEAVTGKNWVTGESLNSFERGIAVMGVMTLGTGSIAKNSIRVFDKATTLLLQTKKIIPEQALSKKLVNTNASLFSSFKNAYWRKGDELNEALRLELNLDYDKFINPWQKGRRVFEFTTTKEITLYRVFGEDMSSGTVQSVAALSGRWLTNIDPSKVSKEVFSRLFNLPAENKMLSYIEVKIPAGNRMRLGVTGKSSDGVRGGGTQFDLIDQGVDDSWVTQIISYGEK